MRHDLQRTHILTSLDADTDMLKKIGNRIKTLRIRAGDLNYEKFAYRNNMGRMLLRRAETAANINLNNLLKIIQALDVTLPEFYEEGSISKPFKGNAVIGLNLSAMLSLQD